MLSKTQLVLLSFLLFLCGATSLLFDSFTLCFCVSVVHPGLISS